MKPGNTDLDKLLERLLPSIEKNTPNPKPLNKKATKAKSEVKDSKQITIKKVLNNLPYPCIVEIEPPAGIDWVYYAVVDSKDKRLFFQSEYPTKTTLSAFSIHKLPTKETNLRFVCWPVIKDKMGTPTYHPLPVNNIKQLGIYDLEVNFEKEADLTLYQQVKPLIEKHYGKAALPGVIEVEEATSDIYLPASNLIRLSADRRNIIHELIHTCRKQVLFANKKYIFNEETEMIEEFFAEGVSNMVKDELNESPNDYLQEGAVYGSTLGYNYDFRIADACIKTQDLQSTCGGILTLENARYYLASEAFHKIAIEYFIRTGKYFGKEFNDVYYAFIQENRRDPDKELFFAICENLTPTVERLPTRQWLEQQGLFDCEFKSGEKIFMDIDDYWTHDEWIGITNINLYTTFANGSDWVCDKHKYNQNGQQVRVELFQVASGEKVYSGFHNIPHYENGFGAIKLYFNYIDDSPTTLHFWKQDQQTNIQSAAIKVPSGLYKIVLTSMKTTQIYYRLLGECLFENRDKIIVANISPTPTNATVQIAHYSKAGERTWIEAQSFNNQIAAITVPFIKDKNCEPGVLQIVYDDGVQQQTFQRNIGYGGTYGGHQFLIATGNTDGVNA